MSEFLDDDDVEDIWGSTPDDQLPEPEPEPTVIPESVAEKTEELKDEVKEEIVKVRDK